MTKGSNGNGLVTAGSRIRLRFAADDRLVTSIRRGDPAAFEALYERHSRELLSFCVYLLGSREDAEDAVQTTFAAAYRALRTRERPVALRPWLFTIARNDCLSILRKRRPTVELNGEPALRGDPFRELELRDEVRQMLEGLRELPERQRAALVLAEMHGLSQAEVGVVLGVGAEKVKAYVYQARSHLISERRARDADCVEIREELATARGGTLLRRRLRGHVRACVGCRAYADGVTLQRRQLGALVLWAPSLLLKTRALEHAPAIRSPDTAMYAGGAAAGGSLAGAAAEFAGGAFKGLLAKVAAGVACLGASACVGASVLGTPIFPEEARTTSAPGAHASRPGLTALAGSVRAAPSAAVNLARSGGSDTHLGRIQADTEASESPLPRAPRAPGRRRGAAGAVNPAENPAEGNVQTQAQPSVSEQRQAQVAGSRRTSVGERQRKLEERQRKAEERRQPRTPRPPHKSKEERQREREERPEVGGARPPRKSKEERKHLREERQRERTERTH